MLFAKIVKILISCGVAASLHKRGEGNLPKCAFPCAAVGAPFSLGEIEFCCCQNTFAKARTWTFASTRWPPRAAAARPAGQSVGQSPGRQPTGHTAFGLASWLAGPLPGQPAGQPDASKAFRKEIFGDFYNFAREFLTSFCVFDRQFLSICGPQIVARMFFCNFCVLRNKFVKKHWESNPRKLNRPLMRSKRLRPVR